MAMQDIIIKIHRSLIKTRKTIAVAESCTGGVLSSILTQIPGSSAYFILGLVTYSNRAKTSMLGIPNYLITQKGAVSKEVAEKMAQSVKKLAKTDFGIGLTGIAGPTGGTRQKPVGTVFIAVVSKNKNVCKKFLFKGSRSVIRKKTASKSLEILSTLIDKCFKPKVKTEKN
jgi:nicotinamide-nucleotide amidase